MDKVTVIIPSYNHETFVTESINSVLNQDYKNIELIVIDDGSKDGSVELLKKLASNNSFHLVLKENEGVCATLNRGLNLANGSFITFIASDDFMPPCRISEQVEAFKAYPTAEVIAGSVKIIDEKSHVISSKKVRGKGYLTIDQMFKKNMVFAPTAMFKKEVFIKYGLYKENYLFEDYYMWLKILSSGGKILNIDQVWAFYRISPGNMEKRFNWYFKGYVQTLSDYLPDVRAKMALDQYLLIFCAKMTLLHGPKFMRSNSDKISKLKLHHRIVLRFVSFIPNVFRQKILIYLIREL
jgi:alpha-1,3-rhamnosyltransferase